MTEANLDMDFNLEEDVLPVALIPNGWFEGVVQAVSYDQEKRAIVWQVGLQNNGGFCNDDATEIDGKVMYYRNWLPRPDDTDEKKGNKKRMLKKFAEKMGVAMNTPIEVMTGINEALWMGKEVRCEIATKEYLGEFSNEIKNMTGSDD